MDRTEDRSKEPRTKLVLDDGRIESIQEFISPEELYQDLIERVRKYHPSDDISMIEKAYRLAHLPESYGYGTGSSTDGRHYLF